jgi:hypothetical protein
MDKTTQKSEGDSMTQYKGKDNWKNMISYEIDKMKKDSYGKMVRKDQTADEYWDQEEKDLNESYKESVRQRGERSKRASINKAPKVF